MNETNNTKQAFWVSIGSLFAFAFSIVSSMILSRYFAKEDYGTYKQVIYVYNTLLTVFTLGLPKTFSYFLPRIAIDQARSLIKKITNLFFLLGAVFSLVLFIFSPQIASILKNPDLEYALKIFSPVPLLMLPTMGLEGILSTYRKTQFLALYTVLTRIFMLLCVAVPVVLFGGGYIQAIIGFVVSSFITFLLALYLKNYPVKGKGNEKTNVSYKEIFSFSLPLLYASIWGIVISSTDQFFISRYFGSEVFAEFANGSLELPFVGMIIGATSVVLMPLFSKLIHKGDNLEQEVMQLWTSVFAKSVKLIYPLVLYFWFFADTTMIVLYGNLYENSGTYFRIKLVVDFFRMISFGPLILAVGRTKFYSKVFMYSAIALIGFDYLSIVLFNSPYLVTIISVISAIIRIIIFLFYIANYFKVNFFDLFPLKLIAKIFFPSIIFLLVIRYMYVNLFSMSGLKLLIFSFISYSIIYLIWSYIVNIEYFSIIKPLLNNKFKNKLV